MAAAVAAQPGGAAPATPPRPDPAVRDALPDFYPPFTAAGLIAGGDDNLWIRKPVTKDYPNPRYDVVDRRGRLIGTLSLPKGERVLGVTRKNVYIAWKDDDDIERLRRHPR